MYYEQDIQETGSDHTAVAIRTRGSKNYLSMVKGIAAADSYGHCGRTGTEMLANGSRARQGKTAEQNISRDS